MKVSASITLAVACLEIAAVAAAAQVITEPVPGSAPGEVATIGLDGTIEKFSSTTHTAIVKTADGARHRVHFVSRTKVHPMRVVVQDAFAGLEEGSRVVVHYVVEGNKKTVIEIDRVGGDGLDQVEGIVRHIDRDAKTLTIELADGSLTTVRLTGRAAQHVGKGIEKTNRVVVYWANEGGERVVHYFRSAK